MPTKGSASSAEKPFLQTIQVRFPPSCPKPSRPPMVAAKKIRLRDKEHCKFVAFRPCVICGRTPLEAHHTRFVQPRALGLKSATNTRSRSAGSITASWR